MTPNHSYKQYALAVKNLSKPLLHTDMDGRSIQHDFFTFLMINQFVIDNKNIKSSR